MALSSVAFVALALVCRGCGNDASTTVAPARAGTESSGGAGSGGLGGGTGASPDGGAADGGGAECDLAATIALATPSMAIGGPLRVDDRDVYFLAGEPAALYAAPKSGGDARLVAAGADRGARDFAVDATTIYLVDGSLTYVDKSSGASRTVEADDDVTRLALSTGSVYWVAGDGTIGALPAGGAARTLAAASSHTAPRALAADDAHVWWADDGGVWRVAARGGTAERVSHDGDGYALATDGHSLFVARAASVYAIGASGVAAPIYDEAHVTELASDGHALYVAGDHGVARVSADGRARTLLLPDAAAGVAVDDRYVYFATRDGLFKACK